jgi:hypothetical protein
MMKTPCWSLVYGGVALVALLCGACGEPKAEVPDTVPVSVKIIYKGSPVEGASVTLAPKGEGGRGASGTTDANGVAEMGLPGLTQGAMPGEYWVGVSKVAGTTSDPNLSPEEFYAAQEAEAQSGGDPSASEPAHSLPKKYISAQSSGLECVVTEEAQGQTFEFELKD